MADTDWLRIGLQLGGYAVSSLVGAGVGIWKWGRSSAGAEQAIKDDYKGRIDTLRDEVRAQMAQYEKNASARNDLFVEQFREAFDGIRRQIDNNLLDAERRFLSKPEFDRFYTEYRKDQERTDDKLDRLLSRD